MLRRGTRVGPKEMKLVKCPWDTAHGFRDTRENPTEETVRHFGGSVRELSTGPSALQCPVLRSWQSNRNMFTGEGP